MTPNELIYDWNQMQSEPPSAVGMSALFDETLRDGIQAPNVRKPTLDEKLVFLEHMVAIGVHAADLGYPGASGGSLDDCAALTQRIVQERYPLVPAFAGRTHPADIDAICEVAHRSGTRVEAYAFIGVSPMRQYVEGWDLESISANIRESARRCTLGGVEFVLVLEDALRCTPQVLEALYVVAQEVGARRIALCDTVGGAVPQGAESILRWSRAFFAARHYTVAFDWHGHNDRGLGVINAMMAMAYGYDRVHGTILGVGERAGNASLDQLLVNCDLLGALEYDLSALRRYCEYAAKTLAVDIPANYPAMGRDVFKTSAGVHAAALLKAHEKGNAALKDCVYSSIPAARLGREQEVEIDPFSGASNVRYWLQTRGFRQDERLVDAVLRAAKVSLVPLRDEQILTIVSSAGG